MKTDGNLSGSKQPLRASMQWLRLLRSLHVGLLLKRRRRVDHASWKDLRGAARRLGSFQESQPSIIGSILKQNYAQTEKWAWGWPGNEREWGALLTQSPCKPRAFYYFNSQTNPMNQLSIAGTKYCSNLLIKLIVLSGTSPDEWYCYKHSRRTPSPLSEEQLEALLQRWNQTPNYMRSSRRQNHLW